MSEPITAEFLQEVLKEKFKNADNYEISELEIGGEANSKLKCNG